jgi:integrase
MTLSDYLAEWLETYVTPFRRPNTIACYRRCIAGLPSALAAVELAQLDGLRLQRAINTQAAQHERTAQLTYAVLHAAMARAVRLRLLTYSPMDGCDKPRHTPERAAILDRAQITAYLAAARHSDTWPLLMLITTLGLRRGEALGLRWVDLQGGVLHVQHQRIGGELAPLKSAASNRRLTLPNALQMELMMWPHSGAYIVDTWPKHLYAEHYKAVQAAGLPHVTLHGLRHSYATASVACATPIKVLQAILGHSTYKLTADLYADHVADAAYTAPSIAYVCDMVL